MPNVPVTTSSGTQYYKSSQAGTNIAPHKSAEDVEAAINTLTTKLPATLGSTTASGSLAVALSSNGPFSTAVGTPSQSEATTDTGSFTVLQFIKRGLQNWTTLLARIPVLVSGRVPVNIASDQSAISVVPTMSSGGNLSATTAAIGTNWSAFGSQALRQLTISNQTGATLEFRQGGAGVGFQVPTANFYTFFGLTNANQIEVRRVDTTNTQVTVTARWES